MTASSISVTESCLSSRSHRNLLLVPRPSGGRAHLQRVRRSVCSTHLQLDQASATPIQRDHHHLYLRTTPAPQPPSHPNSKPSESNTKTVLTHKKAAGTTQPQPHSPEHRAQPLARLGPGDRDGRRRSSSSRGTTQWLRCLREQARQNQGKQWKKHKLILADFDDSAAVEAFASFLKRSLGIRLISIRLCPGRGTVCSTCKSGRHGGSTWSTVNHKQHPQPCFSVSLPIYLPLSLSR
jgi:hypothetical protein